jgi:hypothetical protein
MASVHGPQTVPARMPRVAGPRRWRWTAKQFHKLANMGFFGDRKVELINGDLYPLPVNPPHDTALNLTFRALEAAFGIGYYVRPQMTLDLGRRYQPLPDDLVVAGSPRDHATKHPTTGVLLAEIADSSLRRDRTIKAHRYARAGIADSWIVNLIDRQLEFHRNPQPDPARRGRFHYADVTIVPATGQAAPLARPQARIAVADLLP